MDPECINGMLTKKMDVYSFGARISYSKKGTIGRISIINKVRNVMDRSKDLYNL